MMTTRRWMLLLGTVLMLPVGCAAPREPAAGQAAANSKTPGFTGRTVVPGNHSTIASDAGATEQQQKWPFIRP